MVRRMRSTAAVAFRWRGLKRPRKGSFHTGSRSVALDSVSFNAV